MVDAPDVVVVCAEILRPYAAPDWSWTFGPNGLTKEFRDRLVLQIRELRGGALVWRDVVDDDKKPVDAIRYVRWIDGGKRG